MFKEHFEKVIAGQDLSITEMEAAMRQIMEGKVQDCQIAGMLVGLRMKGETIDEITAAARVMREKAAAIKSNVEMVVDTCGTGGDLSNTFNISTTVSLVLAGAGLTVAKHGNRSVSSKSGGADVLEALGVKITLTPAQVENCVNTINLGFLFAPNFHQAMKYAVRPRKELGIRTIFNILGPLTNPAAANYQVLGVYHPTLIMPLARVLKNLGVKSAMVVNGNKQLDEFTLTGPNQYAYLHDGLIEEITLKPEEIGLSTIELRELQGGNPVENAELIIRILKGEPGPRRDVVLLNAAAAFLVTGLVASWTEGLALAAEIIDSGKALQKLKEFIDITNSLGVAM